MHGSKESYGFSLDVYKRQAMRRKVAPSVLVCSSGIKMCKICGAKRVKQATKQADITRAVFQENTETWRIRL